jgi:ribosomal protein S18 acetylase RimI-like enzyme
MVEGCGVPPAQTIVRPATRRDVSDVAELHAAAIDEGFLSTLGVQFLRRLYTRITDSPHAFLIVADGAAEPQRQRVAADDRSGRVVGFVAGAMSKGRLYRQFLVRDGLPAALSSAPQLARSLPRAIETLRYGTSDHGTDREPVGGDRRPGEESELLAMAVAVGGRRRGTGAALVSAFQLTAAQLGSSSARVVVGAKNHGAIALYHGAGFQTVRCLELHAGAESLLLRADLQHISRR